MISPEIFFFLISNALLSWRPNSAMFVSGKTTCHNWKISSSLSLSFLVSLVIVRGIAPCDARCSCILKDELSLCDLVSGRESDVLLVQAASMAATLKRRNRWKDEISLRLDMIPTVSLWQLQKLQWIALICYYHLLRTLFINCKHSAPKQELVQKKREARQTYGLFSVLLVDFGVCSFSYQTSASKFIYLAMSPMFSTPHQIRDARYYWHVISIGPYWL